MRNTDFEKKINEMIVCKFQNQPNVKISIQTYRNRHRLHVSVVRNGVYIKTLYYQVYYSKYDYCYDVYFVPVKNIMNDSKLFSNWELRTIFKFECEFIEDYCINNLFL
jgi:hypothetical protein